MQNIVIFGSSGHAKVVIDIIEKGNKYHIVGLIDSFAKNLTHGITIAWQNMPFQKGCMANWAVFDNGKGYDLYNALLRGDRNFFICGDQLSFQPGWMEGAVLSAHHTVRLMTDNDYKKKIQRA